MTKQEFEALVSRALADALELGYEGYMERYNAIVNLFDKARAPFADAAWFLYSVQRFNPAWLKDRSREDIQIQAKSLGEAAFKMGLPVSERRTGASTLEGLLKAGYVLFGMSAPIYYPDRQATADAAEFLVTRVGVGSYWLKNVGAQHIRADAKEFEAMLKSREVEVKISVTRLLEGENGGYIDLKFFKGDAKVGETTIGGKTASPYTRTITLSGNYDMVRCESSPSALYSFERVKK